MSVLTSLQSILTDISDALRSMNNTSRKYAISEIADAIREGCQVYYLGQGTSFNVSTIRGYKNLTADNFIIEPIGITNKGDFNCYYAVNIEVTSTFKVSKGYNAETGIFTCSSQINESYYADESGDDSHRDYLNFNVPVKAYLVVGSKKSI